MRKSVLSLMGLLVVLSLVLAACGPAATPTPEVIRETVEVPVERTVEVPVEVTVPPAELSGSLKIWTMPNGADPQGAIDAEIAAFNEIYPNVEVTAEIVGWGDAYGLIQTAVQGGEGPCITQMGTTWVPTFGTMGGLHTFTPGEIGAVGGAEAFVDASWATAGIYNNIVSIPWFADARVMFYRTDVLEQVGLSPEEAFADLDAMEAALQAIADSDLDIDPLVHPGRNDWNVWQNASMWIWAYGGDILSEDGTQAVFNSDEAVAGVTHFNSLFGKGLTAADTLELNSAQAEQRFGDGLAAMVISGPYVISNLRDTENSGWNPDVEPKTGVAAFPPGPGGQFTFIGGSNLGIMTNCPNYDAALEFVKFLLTKESQIRYGNAIGMLPVTLEAQSAPVFTEDPLYRPFIDVSAQGKTSMNIPKWGAVENTYQIALQGLWEDVAAAGLGTPIDEATVKAGLDEAAATLNTLLAQ